MRSVVTPETNCTASCEPEALDERRGSCSRDLGLPMTTRWASGRSARTLASASSSGARPFIGTSALAVVMRRPGTRAMFGQRAEDLGIDADGHDVQPVGGHAHLGDDVALRRLRHGDEARDLARHFHLHAEEAVPTAQRELAVPARGVREVEVAVDGDRVVQRGHHRPAVVLDHLQRGRGRGTGCRG